MSSADSGGPAFPLQSIGPEFSPGYAGMTLRDYFAAKALAGFLASPHQDYAPLVDDKVWMLAREAYKMADAMLEARQS